MTVELPPMTLEFLVINNWAFKSKAHFIKALQRILQSTPVKTAVDGSLEQAFLINLFQCHPEHAGKTQGRQTTHIEVHHNKGRTKCFHAAFADGSSVHFSYKKCLAAGAEHVFVPSNQTGLFHFLPDEPVTQTLNL